LTQEIVTDPLTYANVGSLTKAGKAAKATPAMIKGIDTTADALKAVDAASDAGRELSALNTVLKAAEAGDKTADTASAIGRINEISKSFAKQGDVVGKGVAKDLKHIAKTTDNLTPSLITRAAKGDNAISLGSNWGKQASMGQRAAVSLAGRPLIQGGKALEGAEKATKALKGMKAFNAASNTAKAANIGTEAAGKVKGILSSADDAVRFGKKGAVKAFDDALAPVLERVKTAGDDVDEFLKNVTDKYENPWTIDVAADGAKTPIRKVITADEEEAINLIEKTMGDLRAAEVSEGINTPLLAEAKEVVDPDEIISMVEEGKPFRYLPHRLSAEEIELAKATKGKALLAGDDFTKTRKLRQSVEGLEEGGINPFEKNAGVASKKRISESVKAVEDQRMMQSFGEITDEAGRPLAQRAEDMEHIKEFGKGTTGDMTEKWVPKMEEGQKTVKVGGVDWVVDSALADDMERVFKRMEEAQGAGKIFDKLTDAWRVTATILNPGFHARNAYSNWWNIYLGFGAEGLDPRRHHLTRDVLLRMKDKRSIGDFLAGNPSKALGDLADKVIHTKSGRAISVLEFAEEAAKRGALDVGYMGLADEAVLKAGKSMANPVRWGRAAGTRVEGHARLTAFLNGVIETGDFDEAASLMKKYLFDYGDLSPFEKQLRRFVPFYCVSEDTECLTREGWKTHNTLRVGDEALTYNLNAKCFEWKPVRAVFEAPYDYNLFHFYGKSIDLLCTFDHRCVTGNGLRKAYEVSQADTAPMQVSYEKEDYPISDVILKLIAWVVTDGYSRKRKGFREIVVYQKKPEHLESILALVGADAGTSIHPETGVTCVRINGDTRREIVKHYDGKETLWALMVELSPRQLNLMREVMMDAEGSGGYRDATKSFEHFAQKGKEVTDCFQLATVLAGTISNVSSKGIYLRNKPTVKYPKPVIVPYRGTIWCPKTDNDTWVARRNGKVLVTGNTWTRKNLPLQLSQIVQQPGKYAGVGKVMRASQQAAGLDESNTPGYFNDLAAFPIPGLKFNGVPQFLNPNLPFQDLQKIPFPTNGWAGLNNTAQEAIGMVNPLIKGAVELSTKRENFLNRELYPTAGKKVQVNPIIGDLMKIPGVGDLLKSVMGAEEINSYWDENQRVMGVSPNADYLTRQIPFLANVGKWTGAEETPPGKYVPNLLTTLAGIKVMPYDQPLEKEKVAWENKQRLVDKMSELEKQQGINLPSLASTEDYLQYQAATPLMDKVDFAASQGIEDAGSADAQKAYLDYLRSQAGVSGPLDVDEVDALNTAVRRKEKYLPTSDNIERYLRYLAGTPTYTQATHSKVKKLDNDTPEAATAYMKYLMSEAGVTGKLDMDDYSAFQLAYWLGQAEVPPAKKAPTAKKKKKKNQRYTGH
jgi:hypothetical protein